MGWSPPRRYRGLHARWRASSSTTPIRRNSTLGAGTRAAPSNDGKSTGSNRGSSPAAPSATGAERSAEFSKNPETATAAHNVVRTNYSSLAPGHGRQSNQSSKPPSQCLFQRCIVELFFPSGHHDTGNAITNDIGQCSTLAHKAVDARIRTGTRRATSVRRLR